MLEYLFSKISETVSFLGRNWVWGIAYEMTENPLQGTSPTSLKSPELQRERLESYKDTCLRTKSKSLWFKPQATASF